MEITKNVSYILIDMYNLYIPIKIFFIEYKYLG